jgi:glycerophosphoryl diester phosphodiesterase
MRFVKFCFVFTGLLFSCNKNHDNLRPKIIAHAGSGLAMPNALFADNSMQGIQHSLSEGVDGVEVDVQLSKDQQLVLYHDEYLSSKTNFASCVYQYSASELTAHCHYTLFPSENIALLSAINVGNKYLMLDLRSYDFCAQKALDSTILLQKCLQYRQNNPSTQLIVNASQTLLLDCFQHHQFKVAFDAVDAQELSKIAALKKYPYYTVRNHTINISEVAQLQQQGYQIIIFDMHSHKGIQEAIKKHPAFIMPDNATKALNMNK